MRGDIMSALILQFALLLIITALIIITFHIMKQWKTISGKYEYCDIYFSNTIQIHDLIPEV